MNRWAFVLTVLLVVTGVAQAHHSIAGVLANRAGKLIQRRRDQNDQYGNGRQNHQPAFD